MSVYRTGQYRRSDGIAIARLIAEIPQEEMDAIDAWGVPAGMKSRTATVRHILKAGLDALTREPAAGNPGRI